MIFPDRLCSVAVTAVVTTPQSSGWRMRVPPAVPPSTSARAFSVSESVFDQASGLCVGVGARTRRKATDNARR